MALTTDGRLYVWDGGRTPRHVSLGRGERAVSISAARYTTLAVTHAGHVYSWEEHWHTSWQPPPSRVAEVVQVVPTAVVLVAM